MVSGGGNSAVRTVRAMMQLHSRLHSRAPVQKDLWPNFHSLFRQASLQNLTVLHLPAAATGADERAERMHAQTAARRHKANPADLITLHIWGLRS